MRSMLCDAQITAFPIAATYNDFLLEGRHEQSNQDLWQKWNF